MLTSSDEKTLADITGRLPSKNRGVEFRLAKHTLVDLESAARAAEKAWQAIGSPTRLLGVNVDVPRNRLVLRVEADGLKQATSSLDAMQASLGVSVSVEVDEPDVDTAVCTSRANCYDPVLKAGIHIHQDAVPSPIGNICTMGFHMTIGTDEQFVTSGHCGIFSSHNDWYHSVNFGFVGNEAENLILSEARDIMRVQLPDARATNKIYGETRVVGGHGLPITGAAVKVSLGYGSNTMKTGTVTASSVSWTSSTCGCTVWGSDASWTTIPGDSGSPVYRVYDASYVDAIGVNDNKHGKFAKIHDMFIYGSGGGIFVP